MINIHTHSEFSMLDGFGNPKLFVETAKKLNQNAIALTEHGNTLSAICLQQECKKQNIKAIFGCEFYIVDDVLIKHRSEKRNHMVIIAKNNKGFQDIQKLVSFSNKPENFYYRPRIDYNTLLKIDLKNVFITTACPASFIFNKNIDRYTNQLLENNADILAEIQPHQHEIHYLTNKAAYEYAIKYDLDLIGCVDAHCPTPEDTDVQEVLMCVQTSQKMSDPNRFKLPCPTYHLMNDKQFIDLITKGNNSSIPLEEIQDSLYNTQAIADECEAEILTKKISLPVPVSFQTSNAPDELFNLCKQGLKTKYNIDYDLIEDETPYLYYAQDEQKIQKYQLYTKRMEYEFEILNQKGFCAYFLIVYDFIIWCRKNDIPVGPGRGSCAGSLISNLLNITHLDPIEHGLIFERFLNPERNDYPDIDIDISQKKRKQAIEYITKTYGEDNTGYIVTFLKMKTKMAVRDISRSFDINLKEVDNFAKSCFSYNRDDLEEGLDSAYGRLFNAKYPEVVKYIKKARGAIRNTSVHASGIIVNNSDLMNGSQCSVIRDKNKQNRKICGIEMSDCEDQGLMKLDVLGIATLDVLHHCRKLTGIEWEQIDLNDKQVYKEISNGKTLGGFQIEAKASTEVVVDIKPNNFSELVACLALVRPGPKDSGMTDMYIKRKHGEHWDDINSIYAQVTKETYGVLAYQESVMMCLVELAGLSFAFADKIRKIIGKKRDEKEFAPYYEEFKQGCLKQNTLTETQAKEFWDGLLKWASYGFAKAHAASYALNTYWCMWYKVYYPEVFYPACLSFASWNDKSKDISKHKITMINTMIINGYTILTPKTGYSDGHIWIHNKKTNCFYMPFDCIAGLDTKADIVANIKPKSKLISIFDDDEIQESQAETSIDRDLAKMLCHDHDVIPDNITQTKYLGFVLPFQKKVIVKKQSNVYIHTSNNTNNTSGTNKIKNNHKKPEGRRKINAI